MKIRLFFLSLFIGSMLCCPVSLLGDSERPLPFLYGERLTFNVKWLFIPAGEAVLKVMPPQELDGIPVNHFRMTARTYEYIDPIYKVRDQIDSYADIEMTQTLLYLIQAQGKEKKDVIVTFDRDKETVQFSDFGSKQEPISVPPGSFDPLSMFYALRFRDLEVGATLEVAVTDGKKSVVGRAKVIRQEEIKVPVGTFFTYLVEPELEHIGGVFRKSKGAKLQIWVTADKSRLPVRIKSEVAVGSFIAELIEARNIDL